MAKKNGHFDIGMSNEDYHNNPAISKSGLSEFSKSAEHYWTAYLDPDRSRFETPAMSLGTAIHCAVLEPLRFQNEYIKTPKIDGRTKEGKAKKAELEAQAGEGKKLIEEDEYEICEKIRKRFYDHPIAGPLLGGNRYVEASFFWKDEETGVECKCRPDLVNLERGFILDVKSAREVQEHGFERAIDDYKYYLQVPHYSAGIEAVTGVKIKAFLFAAWEKKKPFGLKLYHLDDMTLQVGHEEWRRYLKEFAECKRTNTWPGYPPHITPIGLSPWALRKRGISAHNN